MPQRAPPAWHSDMQLPGKLLLSAAALLLLSLAFRFYRSRSLPAGKIPPGEQRENRDGEGDGDGDGVGGLRRRRGVGDGGDTPGNGPGNGPGTRHEALRGQRSFPRREEEEEEGEEEGEEVGLELGLSWVKAPLGPAWRESGLGSEPGRKLGWKLGIKSQSKAGTEPGIDWGSEPGSRLGSEPGNELGSETGMELGSQLGGKLGNTAGSKAGIEPGSDLGSELGRKLGFKPGNNPGSKSGSEPGSKLVTNLGNESGSEQASETGIELGNKLGSKLGSKSGSRPGVELGSDPGRKVGSKLGNESGNQLACEPENKMGSKLGSKLGSKAGIEPGSDLGNEPGSKLGSELGNESGNQLASDPGNERGSKAGIELGSELGSKAGTKLGSDVGSKAGIKLGSDLGSKAGTKLGSDLGNNLGSELGSYSPGDVAGTRSSHVEKGTPAPSSGHSPGISDARTAGDGRAQSPEEDVAAGGRSREAKGTIRTLSITSSLGLLMAASEEGSDTSYSFSSVAKIQVEENLIPERRARDGDSQPSPGLRGKVYDYFVQSVSESVSKKTSLPFIPPGTSQHRCPERGQEGLRGSDTQQQDPALEMPDPNTSSTVPPPTRGLGTSLEPPSPGRRDGTLGIAASPQLQLPAEDSGAPAPGPEPSPAPPARPRVHLGNCAEVLRSAGDRGLQDAAYQVMSDHFLEVLRSPDIYGRLRAGERELILRRRMRGRPRLVVAEVPPPEPGHRRGRLCYYDEDEDRWCHLCHIPPEVAWRGCAVSSLFNYLFVVAGWEGTGRARSPSGRVLCYDPLAGSWRDVCPLRQARPRCQLVALDGHLYAIGGECLATVERYDPRRDRWSSVAALPRDTFAVAHAAAACGGNIFVTGGTLRSLLLRYDARGDGWAAGPALSDRDGTAELVSAGGFLYRFQLRRGAGLAVSRCSASAGLWYPCGTHPLPEPAGLRCVALGSLVHCLGRNFHLRFLADPVSPRFGARELRPFPAPHGSLLPAVLVLPEAGTERAWL